MAGLVLAGAAGLALPGSAAASSAPREFLVYYGWPSRINGASDPAAAAVQLGRYDYVVLGAGAEDPDHPDHVRTLAVLADPAMAGTFVFGYVNLGVTNGVLSLEEVRSRIDGWRAVGADAIMLDAFGYDFGVTRDRQNAAVGHAHSLGMPVMVNAWFPADAFGEAVDPEYNPEGQPALLGVGDYYLSESYRVRDGQYTPEELWRAKATEVATYQAERGFSVLSVTTNDPGNAYTEEMFFAAWHAAAADGHLAIGWGEYLFSAPDGLAPYRTRPVAADESLVVEPPAPPDPLPLPVEPLAGSGGDEGAESSEEVPAPVAAFCGGRRATIVGTPGHDVLVGTPGPDVMAGLGGDDTIIGLSGDDLLCGGAGADSLDGGDGDDRLLGGRGHDELRGDAGSDLLRGSGGDDRLAGGDGGDRLLGGAGADILSGDDGDDLLVGQKGDDLLQGGEGFDRARGGPQADACDAERTLRCEA